MPTISELSDQLFRDVDANHQDCVRRLEVLEHERAAALDSIPEAAAALEASRQAAVDAEATREDAFVEIDVELQKAERKASADRALALALIEQGFKDADAASLKARQDAEDKARMELKAELAQITGNNAMNASAKLLSRRAAEERFDEKVRAAHIAFLKSLEANKNSQVDKFRAALTKEVLDWRIARDAANGKRHEAVQLFERALKAAETRLRAALASIPAANSVQREFDNRRAQIKAECRKREEELFAAFRKAKDGLTG